MNYFDFVDDVLNDENVDLDNTEAFSAMLAGVTFAPPARLLEDPDVMEYEEKHNVQLAGLDSFDWTPQEHPQVRLAPLSPPPTPPTPPLPPKAAENASPDRSDDFEMVDAATGAPFTCAQ